ncbi:MAG: DNA recombination protein RmuC [Candidatus Gracilibacteria bacterium]|nr:DNA recombination protein RmuC [Candidatus Gracilibacteria bacterium]
MTLEIALIITVSILLAIIFYLLTKKDNKIDDTSMKMLHEQVLALNKNIDYKLGESNRNTQKNFDINSKISFDSIKKIEEITKKLASLEETNKQIKDIGGQLEGLENILKNTKQRGILGEYFLESVLKNILPPNNYEFQYMFKNGEIVDGVIFVKEKIIPIDSKFSLENYNRIITEDNLVTKELLVKDFKNDIKKRIDETSKYIRPEEGTMDFAFMFIPSEGIYYDLLVNKVGTLKVNTVDLIEYAFKEKKVIIVSPTSFYAYLQTVLQGLRALQIEESAKDIQKQVEKLGKHLGAYEEYLSKLGNSLSTTVNHYNTATKKFGLIEKDVLKITGEVENDNSNIIQISKPEI